MKILTPVDFSEISSNALKYVLSTPFGEPVEICMFHVYSDYFNVEPYLLTGLGDTKKEVILLSLKKYMEDKLGTLSPVEGRMDFKSKEGNPVSQIVEEAEKGSFDLIAMGTRDKYPVIDRWLGTISLGVVKTSRVPVLLIPPKSVSTGFVKILITSDQHLENTEILQHIKSWSRRFHSSVQFLHILEKEDDETGRESQKIVREFFEKGAPEISFEIITEKAADVNRAILQKAENVKADLIIVIPEHQSFLSSLFFESISKGMILSSTIPLLFIPMDPLV